MALAGDERERQAREAAAEKALKTDIEFAEFYYNRAGKEAFKRSLINLSTGKGVNLKAATNLFPPGPHNILNAPGGPHHFLNDGSYKWQGEVYHLKTEKNAAGVEIGVTCTSNRIPLHGNYDDARKLYDGQMDFIILGKGLRTFKHNYRETNPFDAYQFVLELKAVMDGAADPDRRGIVNFGPDTEKHLREIADLDSLPGNKLPGGMKRSILKLTDGKDPMTYFRDRQEQLKVLRSLDDKFTESHDKKTKTKLTEIPRKTEAAAYKVLRTDADRAANLKLAVAADASLGTVNKDAKLNTINTQVSAIAKRIDALNAAYKEVAGRIGTYNKVLDEETGKAWQIKQMFTPNAAGDEHTRELIDEMDKERTELTGLLNAWKDILNTAPYDNTAAAPAESINAAFTRLQTLETNAAAPPPAPGGVPLSAADAETLKILKDIQKVVNSGDTALNNVKINDLNTAFENLQDRTETLLLQPKHQKP